jgi:hypothetical protein
MYTPMYTSMHTSSMCIYIYAYIMDVHIHLYIYVYICVSITDVYIYVHIHVHPYMHPCTHHGCMHLYAHLRRRGGKSLSRGTALKTENAHTHAHILPALCSARAPRAAPPLLSPHTRTAPDAPGTSEDSGSPPEPDTHASKHARKQQRHPIRPASGHRLRAPPTG